MNSSRFPFNIRVIDSPRLTKQPIQNDLIALNVSTESLPGKNILATAPPVWNEHS